MPSSTRLAGVGAFVVAGLLLFAIALFMIGDRQMAFARKFTIYTEFASVTGLQPGAIIRVSGATAGTVREIDPPPDPTGKFRVRLEITEDLHQLVRTDSVAAIQTEGLVGGSFLAISTGSAGNPEAPEGSTIPSREPFQIADLLEQTNATLVKINLTIDDVKVGVDQAIASIQETVDNANALGDVSDDVKTMASAGARMSVDAAEIAEGIRKGEGTLGKLVRDDDLHRRAIRIAENAEAVTADAQQVVQRASRALEAFEAPDGPVAGVAGSLKQTLDDARAAMAGFAENMEALKRNFFFRGFFRNRGYYNLADISPAEYRQGVLANGDRRAVRVWLHERVLFEPTRDEIGSERLTREGQARLDSALAPYLDQITDRVLMVEGYAVQGSKDERYLASRTRAGMVRDYLVGRFHLDPLATGLMPLGAEAADSPDGTTWSGVALALFLDRP